MVCGYVNDLETVNKPSVGRIKMINSIVTILDIIDDKKSSHQTVEVPRDILKKMTDHDRMIHCSGFL